jgi:DNA-binding transcriptional regulator YbjK
MSKKQNQKKKVTVKILPGQAVYVADISTLEHMSKLYRSMSDKCETQEEKQSWIEVSEQINKAILETYFSPEKNIDDEEW